MKKNYSLLTKVLFFSLFMAVPLMFFGQVSTTAKKAPKTQKSTSFTPHLFIQGDFGSSWPNAEAATTNYVPDFRQFQVNGDLAFGWQFLSWMNAYINATRGFLGGQRAISKNTYPTFPGRALNFDADYYGGDINLGFNLSNLFAGYKDRTVNFGIHAGLGQNQWKSRTFDKTTGTYLASHGYKGNSDSHNGGIHNRKVALSVPLGANVDFRVNDKWDLFADYTYTWLDTDLLDGVVSGYGNSGRDGYTRANIGARLKIYTNGIKSMEKKFDAEAKIEVTPQPLVKKGDSVELTVKGTFPPKYFNKKAVMIVQSVLKYEGGEMALDPIKLKGEEVAGDGELISYTNGGSFSHTMKVPYKKGMEVANVAAAPVIYTYSGTDYKTAKDALAGDKKAVQLASKNLATGTIVTPDYMIHSETFAFAPDGYKKVTVSTQQANLYFKINVANLNWHIALNKNKENYNKLKNNLSDLDKGWAVKGITIDGWASPEGEETFNQGLSQRRAATAEKYMKNKIKRELRKKGNAFSFKSLSDVTFTANANGPDWNGFMKAVEKSNISDKAAILNVVNSADESKKEEEIRNMIQIYPELARDILPPLRRAIIKVNAFEPKHTDAEIAALATSPDYAKLKLNELLYAATLTNDLNTKKQIYANAMAKEPRCWRAVANAGAVDLELGNFDAAKTLLQKANKMNGKSYQIYNSMGIMCAIKGNFANAEKAYKKAQSLGANETYNLGLVNIMKGDYAAAEQMLVSSKCDYNLGLAQLLNGHYAAAAGTLKCARETAKVDYLLAIDGARQNNKSMMLEYLSKAVKSDASYASKAARDREFFKFFKDADFKALVSAK